jgi:hypothetical protein
MDEAVASHYRNQAKAEMRAGFLRDQGIPCRVVRAGADIAAVGLDAWVAHELIVPAGDVQRTHPPNASKTRPVRRVTLLLDLERSHQTRTER